MSTFILEIGRREHDVIQKVGYENTVLYILFKNEDVSYNQVTVEVVLILIEMRRHEIVIERRGNVGDNTLHNICTMKKAPIEVLSRYYTLQQTVLYCTMYVS